MTKSIEVGCSPGHDMTGLDWTGRYSIYSVRPSCSFSGLDPKFERLAYRPSVPSKRTVKCAPSVFERIHAVSAHLGLPHRTRSWSNDCSWHGIASRIPWSWEET